jgi:hypothetical protein
VLANPEKAVEYSNKMFFEKMLIYAMAVYTFLLVNDCIAIVTIKPDNTSTF